jgi:hypothetical protein
LHLQAAAIYRAGDALHLTGLSLYIHSFNAAIPQLQSPTESHEYLQRPLAEKENISAASRQTPDEQTIIYYGK